MNARVWRTAVPMTLAVAGILVTPTCASADSTVVSDGHSDPLSVAVQASGGQDVSYAIEVRNTTDQPVTDAVITQQLPAGLDYVAATPAPRRSGHHLTWTLAIPAHGTARITTTGAVGHHLGARPLAHVTQAGTTLHHGHHPQPTTTVCAGENTGPRACATGRGALRPETLTRFERGAMAMACAGAMAALCFAGLGLRRRRRAAGALERAGVEG
ncbi:DUF11 domain-containing protein [Catenulispora sp. NF23]|uniref:DUF11 domain-containing protein n=1 Tax=Catenulispora pinistramenti TaxID=2705254 RepID=UPI001BA8E9CC|nr:DUF11 domain-containing protein [Catenulispora pinistramenti]MBS2535111.1 DUF11 domain-containing protein [Catenulispora pinistramenti]